MHRAVFPSPIFTGHFDAAQSKTVHQQTSATMGMSVCHYFLGQILSGLAANPVTMLDIESHLDYAIRLAEEAEKRTTHWPAY